MKKAVHRIVPRQKEVLHSPRPTKLAAPRQPMSDVQRARIRTLMGPMNQADLATMLEISPAHVSLLVRGRRMPSVEIAGRLARILHVTVDDLLDTLAGK